MNLKGKRDGNANLVCTGLIKDRCLVVDLLSVVYGLGSWIAMTGLWVELPLLVHRLPEGWSLGSSLTLTLQAANIAVVVYGFLNRRFPHVVNERSGTHCQLLIGSVSTFFLIFFWSTTVPFGSSRISFVLYVLAFGLSIVDCTSSVVFLPYMARFRSIYLVPYLVGEGLSGLLPSLVAAAQGIGEQGCYNLSLVHNNSTGNISMMVPWFKEPRFEPEYFFLFLLVMVLLSWVAFILLDTLDICRREMVLDKSTMVLAQEVLQLGAIENLRPGNTEKLHTSEEDAVSVHEEQKGGESIENNVVDVDGSGVNFRTSRKVYFYLLSLQGWASIATFGVFPAIQSYSCLPYGNEPFHYAVTLGGAAYPVACLVALFYESRSLPQISVLTSIANVVSVFILYTAATSPKPPLVDSVAGAPIIVVCWVVFVALFSYVKTMVTVLLSEGWGNRGLFWCGAVTQAGAAIGALVMFLLVNVFDLFQDQEEC